MVYNGHRGGFLMPNVIDKYTPTYDLESFKQSKYEIKMSAIRSAFDLGFNRTDIRAAIQSMERKHFYKSMTSYNNHIWQDVYHVPYKGLVL